jgi:prepilin-type N-terminal cleavage/methylation domain-containing protein
MKRFFAKNNQGFTLLEVIVALTVLTIALSSVSGSFISVIRSQKYAQERVLIINQLSYVVEYLSRALRMARKDDTVGGLDCLPGLSKVNYALTRGGRGIKFQAYNQQCQEFYWDENNKKLKEVKNNVEADLTSNDLEIINFLIGPADSWDQNDEDQPRVTFLIEARSVKLPQISLKIQTSISQRNLDVKR